eukprot:maker-scaffold119_size336447-snap-gene-2.31 protein:Tk11785 transcript:maker-scaffold119_size336447-snap-gene-2.31-mRNA-1 annotation:"wd repeat-containing protein 36"
MAGDSGSKIFVGHRALGYISNQIPLVTRYIYSRREHLIVTCVGKVFHTYGGAKLGLLSVSKIHPENITALAADAYLVFAAAGKDIYAWRRGHELKHIYKGHKGTVVNLMPFGPHLISIDSNSVVKVWDIKSAEFVKEFDFNRKRFSITAVVHPAAYENKILLGSKQGSLQLWNIQAGKKIFKFEGWNSAVTTLEQAPAIDVVAIGLENGEIYVHNLKFDETIVKFSQDWGSVTGLTFRTDGPPILISSSRSGHLAFWDLEERRLCGQMREAHTAAVTGARCLQSEALLVTSSPDNTLKQWVFDMSDGGARLLRIKEGHAAPPHKIRFYGAFGRHILSAGDDSTLRSFSTITELLDKSFGVASYNRKLAKKHKKLDNPVKMEPIIDFTTETTRDRDWDNIAAVHRDTTSVTTWSFGHQKMGDLKLRHPRFKEDAALKSVRATCLSLSICGNFVFIGYESGHVDRFNIQSGIHRGEYGNPAHPQRSVRGIKSDGLNQVVLTGDNQGLLKFWQFSTKKFMTQVKLKSEITSMELQRESSLLAISLQDYSLCIIDIITQTVVRRFPGHGHQITDLSFSADSRWLISSSMDSTVKVWDIPSGHLVDNIAFPTPVTSLTLSPTGEYLATSHVGDLGIYLWINAALYSHISLKPIDISEQPKAIALPLTLWNDLDGSDEAVPKLVEKEIKEEAMEVDEVVFASPEQISENLITLANLPDSRWQNLLVLDVIKARNKPKNMVERPQNAPFFLPTISGLSTTFDLTGETNGQKPEGRVLVPSMIQFTKFGRALLASESPQDYETMLKELKEKGPSAIDVEITSLGPLGGGSMELMVQFLNMISTTLKQKKDFEAAQAYLGLFLKIHSDVVIENEELTNALEEIQRLQEDILSTMEDTITSSATLVAFFKNSLVC